MAPVSFQPWSLDKPAPTDLKDVLARVNMERGHFRDITEASLQEEIATDGALSPSGSSSEDEDEEDEPQLALEGQPKSREELQKARANMIQQASLAHNEVMMALDFVSLLESDRSSVAQNTMSKALKDAVPPKTLGTDIWQRVPVNQEKEAQDATLSYNVKMRSLQKSADDILGAAKRLEDNVRKETQSWDQMLSISEKGWSISRLPRAQKLGVMYGFSESSSEFSGRSVAALNSNADGSISLERGFGARPQGLRVTVCRNGQMTGRSYLPTTSAEEETSLEARIRHSRDSIFDEELFREMIRESRTMFSLGVKMNGNMITLPIGRTGELQLHLVPLSEETGTQLNPANADDTLAQASALGARLLLSQTHREKIQKRSEVPAPMTDRKEDRRITPVLRSIMSVLMYGSALDSINAYIDNISSLLPLASINMDTTRAKFRLPEHVQIEHVEELALALKSTFVSKAQLRINMPDQAPMHTIDFSIESSLMQHFTSRFTFTLGDEQPLQFDSVDALTETSDAAIATLLAQSLHSTAGDGWICHPREALLVRGDGGRNDGAQRVWTTVDGEARTLALATPEKKIVWTPGEENTAKGLIEAWRELTSPARAE